MTIVEYAEFIVKNITKEPDLVKVTSFGGDEGTTIVEIIVCDADMGAVIGKDGKMASAIRTMIQAFAYLHDIKDIKINIDSF
ncbi:MAG: KH domain-containing protein [Firmicutes bacterium]|nr:KH domain-containing protein [Bacillota bacterium]